MQEDFDDEIMFLAKGVQSEIERIERLPLRKYFIALKYTVEAVERTRQQNRNGN